MISFHRELRELRESEVLSDASAERLIALERRDVFSVHPEIRLVAYAGVLMLVSGAVLLLKKYYDLIGPGLLIALVGGIAALCYVWAWSRRATTSATADYVLLLGAMLLSADVAFAEAQYHIFDDAWPRHLLILAVMHAVAAYAYRSRLVLSLSISAFAAWLGIEQNVDTFFDSTPETGARAIGCALVIVVWRWADRYEASRSSVRREPSFEPLFSHFAAHLGLWGALLLTFDRDVDLIGLATLTLFAGASLRYAIAHRSELFAIYAIAYGYVGISAVILRRVVGPINGRAAELTAAGWFILSAPVALTLIWLAHARIGRDA